MPLVSLTHMMMRIKTGPLLRSFAVSVCAQFTLSSSYERKKYDFSYQDFVLLQEINTAIYKMHLSFRNYSLRTFFVLFAFRTLGEVDAVFYMIKIPFQLLSVTSSYFLSHPVQVIFMHSTSRSVIKSFRKS